MYEKVIILFLIINLPIILFYNKIVNKVNIFDYADGIRKLHKNKVPLFGGILIIYNVVIFSFFNEFLEINIDYFFLNTREYFSFYVGLVFIFLIGIYDDKYNLSANKKLFFNFFIILSIILADDNLLISNLKFIIFDSPVELKNLSYFFSILCILLFINALNMFDGINFQAGFYCILIFCYFLIKDLYTFFSIILILCLILFLIFNYLNKCFLGDSGTQVLAFIISYILIKSHNINNLISPEEIFILLSFPGLDMFRLFIQRILINKHPFHPDTNHMHHLISARHGKFYAFIIIQVIIITNISSFYIFENKYISLSYVVISYILILINFKTNKFKF